MSGDGALKKMRGQAMSLAVLYAILINQWGRPLLIVEVTREAEAGKGPVLKFRALSKLDKTGRISGDNLQDFIAKRFNNNITFEFAQVNTIESALEREISVPGGGDIAIDFTRALVAIDVDKGAAQSGFNVGKSV